MIVIYLILAIYCFLLIAKSFGKHAMKEINAKDNRSNEAKQNEQLRLLMQPREIREAAIASKTKTSFDAELEANQDKLRVQVKQNESLRKLMQPRLIREEGKISNPSYFLQPTIRQYTKIYDLSLEQSLAHLNSIGFRCYADDELKTPIRKVLDGMYRNLKAEADKDEKLKEQVIEDRENKISTTDSRETKTALDPLVDRAIKQQKNEDVAQSLSGDELVTIVQQPLNSTGFVIPEISIRSRSSWPTIRQYTKTYDLPLEQSLTHLSSFGLSCNADDVLNISVREVLDEMYLAIIKTKANKDKILKEQANKPKRDKKNAKNDNELVTVAHRSFLNSSAFIIPDSPSPNANIQLDMNRVDALKIESKKVADMIGVLFEQDAYSENLMPIQTPDDPIADNENLLGLDNAHSNLIKLLCSRIQWSRAELEEIALDAGMMLDGALEHINDATYDTFDAALTEGDDPIDINQNILKELLK